jgi:hypothetical protein
MQDRFAKGRFTAHGIEHALQQPQELTPAVWAHLETDYVGHRRHCTLLCVLVSDRSRRFSMANALTSIHDL